jgi:hypothetical protein
LRATSIASNKGQTALQTFGDGREILENIVAVSPFDKSRAADIDSRSEITFITEQLYRFDKIPHFLDRFGLLPSGLRLEKVGYLLPGAREPVPPAEVISDDRVSRYALIRSLDQKIVHEQVELSFDLGFGGLCQRSSFQRFHFAQQSDKALGFHGPFEQADDPEQLSLTVLQLDLIEGEQTLEFPTQNVRFDRRE